MPSRAPPGDIPIRRGGALLPDVQRHLLACRYCRDAAEQLALCAGDVGVLLTDAVLGWGARRYLESRPGRGADKTAPGAPTGRVDRRAEGGRHRLLPGTIPLIHRFTSSRKHSKPLLSGLGLVSATVLSAVLVPSLWSDDGRHPGSAASVGPAAGARALPPPRTSTTCATTSRCRASCCLAGPKAWRSFPRLRCVRTAKAVHSDAGTRPIPLSNRP